MPPGGGSRRRRRRTSSPLLLLALLASRLLRLALRCAAQRVGHLPQPARKQGRLGGRVALAGEEAGVQALLQALSSGCGHCARSGTAAQPPQQPPQKPEHKTSSRRSCLRRLMNGGSAMQCRSSRACMQALSCHRRRPPLRQPQRTVQNTGRICPACVSCEMAGVTANGLRHRNVGCVCFASDGPGAGQRRNASAGHPRRPLAGLQDGCPLHELHPGTLSGRQRHGPHLREGSTRRKAHHA